MINKTFCTDIFVKLLTDIDTLCDTLSHLVSRICWWNCCAKNNNIRYLGPTCTM